MITSNSCGRWQRQGKNERQQSCKIRIAEKVCRCQKSALNGGTHGNQRCGKQLDRRAAEAPEVVAYAADSSEVDVRGVIELALQNGKSVALPRYNPERKLYELVFITDFERDTAPGKYGLPEPHKDLPVATLGEKPLWLIPALAFDKYGTRLGRGGGFYDRMLENAPGIRVGVFYQCQYSSEALPCEEHDQKLAMAVTEKSVYRF